MVRLLKMEEEFSAENYEETIRKLKSEKEQLVKGKYEWEKEEKILIKEKRNLLTEIENLKTEKNEQEREKRNLETKVRQYKKVLPNFDVEIHKDIRYVSIFDLFFEYIFHEIF